MNKPRFLKTVWIKTAALMMIVFGVDMALFAFHIQFWVVVVVTVGIFLGADTYYQHKSYGGHEDE